MLTGSTRMGEESAPVESLVVMLHGYGANGDDLIDLSDHWLQALPNTLFWAPNAPSVCEVNPMGYQWFGLQDLTPFNLRQGLDSSTPKVAEVIRTKLAQHNLTPEHLILVGFSQGAMLALDLMFHLQGLLGVVAYSGCFYPPSKGLPGAAAIEPKPSVLLVHGVNDMMVPFISLENSKNALATFGIEAQALAIPGLAHGIDITGIKRGEDFLTQHFTEQR